MHEVQFGKDYFFGGILQVLNNILVKIKNQEFQFFHFEKYCLTTK